MCATIEPHLDLLFGDIHGGGHVDEVAEDHRTDEAKMKVLIKPAI
jgi:hypothetical protein